MAGKRTSKRKSTYTANKAEERGRHFAGISIKNFRCFKDFSMDSLECINLIGGKNNVGKTSLLEALFLLLGTTNISLILKINAFRGVEKFIGESRDIREILWNHLFYNFNNQTSITINGKLGIGGHIGVTLKQTIGEPTILPISRSISENSEADIGEAPGYWSVTGSATNQHDIPIIDSGEVSTQTLRLEYSDVSGKTSPVDLRIDAKGIFISSPVVEPMFPGIFHSATRRPSNEEISVRYGQLELNKAETHYDLLQPLKIIEPRLNRLSTIVSASGPMIYGDIGLKRPLPLTMMGDGLVRLISLLTSISSASGGVVLFDEIENGLHYSVMAKVWQTIAEASRIFNTQVFATTHSWDCIKAAHEAFETSSAYDFRYHRLQKVDERIEAVSIDQDALQTAIELGWEIR